MPNKFDGAYYTVEDIAQARSITPQGVRKAIADKRLTATKVAGVWLVKTTELVEKGWVKTPEESIEEALGLDNIPQL